MEGEETERLAGFTARAASAPDGLQSGREMAGSCSVYMPSSRLLPRGSERVYDYAGGREERKRNVVDVPKYAPFRLFPSLRLLLLLLRLMIFCFYRAIFRTLSLPSKLSKKEKRRCVARAGKRRDEIVGDRTIRDPCTSFVRIKWEKR